MQTKLIRQQFPLLANDLGRELGSLMWGK